MSGETEAAAPAPQQSQAGKAGWTPERRAAQAERIRQRAAARKASGSPSTQSSGSRRSSGPAPLPPSVSAASPEQTTNLIRMMETLAKRLDGGEADDAKPARVLPDTWEEREKALRLAKLPARIPVVAIDELFRSMGQRELSAQEREEGVDAWAALFWELGLFNSGKVLVALWLFGVGAPRFADWVEDRRRARAGKPTKAEQREAKERGAGSNGADQVAQLSQALAQANAQLAAMRAELDALKSAQKAVGLS